MKINLLLLFLSLQLNLACKSSGQEQLKIEKNVLPNSDIPDSERTPNPDISDISDTPDSDRKPNSDIPDIPNSERKPNSDIPDVPNSERKPCKTIYYVGECKGGKRDGYGIENVPMEYTYDGEWKDDKRHGHGVLKYRGLSYDGHFQNNKRHGHGVLKYRGLIYDGQWQKDKRHGYGIKISPEGDWIAGRWNSDRFVPQYSNIGDLKFLSLLVGNSDTGGGDYPIVIMAEFLKHLATKDRAYEEVSRKVSSAAEIFNSKPSTELSSRIKDELEKGHSVLIPYGHETHMMGLDIVPVNNQFFDFDLFNAGDGLDDFHECEGSKCQTAIRVEVPAKEVSRELIFKLLNPRGFRDAKEAYYAILNIPGAQLLTHAVKAPIWQSPQRSGNCSLQWIFAYLKNTLKEPLYSRMRGILFKDALEEAERQGWPKALDPEKHMITLARNKKYKASEAKKIILKELRAMIEANRTKFGN